ncbi:MAG: TetR/AcrR family transcriptional regulator [Bacteroidales bacterium]|nr:TetR/AcrR family transcriptional regulator [Bacteroidales bacterium]
MEIIKRSEKRDSIVSTARTLFWRFGFRKVSIDEICAKSGVSKMTFYRHFPNKTELAKYILKNLIDKSMKEFREIMNSDCSTDERMNRIIRLKLEGVKEISKEFIEDVYTNNNSEIQQFMLQKTEEAWVGFIQEFRNAQDRGVFRKGFKPELLLALSRQMINLLEDKSIMDMYSSPQELIMELTTLTAYGIAPEKE